MITNVQVTQLDRLKSISSTDTLGESDVEFEAVHQKYLSIKVPSVISSVTDALEYSQTPKTTEECLVDEEVNYHHSTTTTISTEDACEIDATLTSNYHEIRLRLLNEAYQETFATVSPMAAHCKMIPLSECGDNIQSSLDWRVPDTSPSSCLPHAKQERPIFPHQSISVDSLNMFAVKTQKTSKDSSTVFQYLHKKNVKHKTSHTIAEETTSFCEARPHDDKSVLLNMAATVWNLFSFRENSTK
jgi:hypothetical protein